jgi:hypothetical protein
MMDNYYTVRMTKHSEHPKNLSGFFDPKEKKKIILELEKAFDDRFWKEYSRKVDEAVREVEKARAASEADSHNHYVL